MGFIVDIFTLYTPQLFCDIADKSSSIPSSSQELADIFGMDNEGQMDFPFNLSTEAELSLPNSREADYFLNSLNTLGIPGPVTASSSTSSTSLVSDSRSKGGVTVGIAAGGQAQAGVQMASSTAAVLATSLNKATGAAAAVGNKKEEVGMASPRELSSSEGMRLRHDVVFSGNLL